MGYHVRTGSSTVDLSSKEILPPNENRRVLILSMQSGFIDCAVAFGEDAVGSAGVQLSGGGPAGGFVSQPFILRVAAGDEFVRKAVNVRGVGVGQGPGWLEMLFVPDEPPTVPPVMEEAPAIADDDTVYIGPPGKRKKDGRGRFKKRE